MIENDIPINHVETLIADRPRIYRTSYQEIALIGISLIGMKFAVARNQEKGFWEQIITGPDDREIKRGQITNSSSMNDHEIFLYEPHCPGGEFYDRLRLATKDDFNAEIE